MRASDVLFIGFGQAGNAITAKVMETSKRVSGMFVNTNMNDLQNIKGIATEDNTFIVPAASGTGRDRTKAKEYLIKQRYAITDLLKDYPNLKNIHVCFSMGGGTGSGMGPGFIRMIEQMFPEIRVNVVAVLPKRDDSQKALYNTLMCWNDLQKVNNIDTIYLLDNEKRVDVTEVNEEFADAFTKFLNVQKSRYSANSNTIDGAETDLLSKAAGVSAIYVIDNDFKGNVTDYVAKVMRKSVFVLNSKDCEYFGVVADEDFDSDELYEQFNASMDHWLCISDTAQPMLMISGTAKKCYESLFQSIKDIYEKKATPAEVAENAAQDDDDDFFEVLVEEKQSRKARIAKRHNTEPKKETKELSDDDWAELLNM